MFIMDNSASLNHNLLYYTMGKTSGDSSSGTFSSAEAFQKVRSILDIPISTLFPPPLPSLTHSFALTPSLL